MHKLWIFLIGLVLLIAGFASAFPAALYTAQQFNTNLFVAFIGGVLIVVPLGMRKNGS
jgi:hypothetical protein